MAGPTRPFSVGKAPQVGAFLCLPSGWLNSQPPSNGNKVATPTLPRLKLCAIVVGMDPTTEQLIALAGGLRRELAERDELLAHAAKALEHNVEALERAAMQHEALRRLTKFVF